MPSSIQDKIRISMITGGSLKLEFAPELNDKSPGTSTVYLHEVEIDVRVRVDLDSRDGELATILWLPWKQGELTTLQPFSVGRVPSETLFLTYYLSGCKVFAIRGGPIWHIDAPIRVEKFWPQIRDSEWVQENWSPGTNQDVAYLHRAGQGRELWDLSPYLDGGPPSTYGSNNIGQAIVGGVVNSRQAIDLYFQASPWAPLEYTSRRLKK